MIESLYEPFQKWGEKGAVFCIADTHFDEDEDLRIVFPERPTSEEMVKLINRTCGKASTILFLGDIGNPEWIKKIRGYKVMLTGNHDVGKTIYKEVFDEVYGHELIISDKIILSHVPLSIDWKFNIHGHTHTLTKDRPCHKCVCADVIDYIPLNLNQFIKSGRLTEIKPIVRTTIDKATERKQKRGPWKYD